MSGGVGRLVAVVGCLCLLSCLRPADAIAQVLIASQPKPEFTIGPLFVRANVGLKAGPVDVTVLFSVVPPAAPGKGQPAQDLYLLRPGEVGGETVPGAPDAELRRTVEERGFEVTREGRLHHEVEIELDGDRVRDGQAQVHRSRQSQPGTA